MNQHGAVRWGIISTARIARTQFVPGVRAAGGLLYSVAARDHARAEAFARDNGIERAVEGYQDLLDDEQVDAVYIPLPNSLHAEWTLAALRAGKAVLCEKPLCASLPQTHDVLAAAGTSRFPLWEAFVFPFHAQFQRVKEIIAQGGIGRIREVESTFHFRLTGRDNIRLDPGLAGGALNDVGCYCLRFAQLILDAHPRDALAVAVWAPEGVDEEMQAIVSYGDDRRLLLSCGMAGPVDTFARILGDEGEIRLSSPFHPTAADTIEIVTTNGTTTEHATGSQPSFTRAIEHIQAVIRGEERPRHTARHDSLETELGLDVTLRAARSERREEVADGAR